MNTERPTRREHIKALAAGVAVAAAPRARAENPNVAYGKPGMPAGIRSRFVQNGNGLNVHFLEAGFENPGRPCILFLHGFPELAYSWRNVLAPIAAAGYHVIAPDQRGYGRTTGWDSKYDTDLTLFKTLSLVRDALGLVSALGYREVAAVVGHDAGAPVAGWCALIRPDVFKRVAIMSAPFTGAPSLPFNTAGRTANQAALSPDADLDGQLAALPRPRKHYQRYYATREADKDLRSCPQGLHDFFRAYYYYKSADWKGNQPFPLKARTAAEMSQMPTYYIMDLGKNMCETVAEHMPSKAEIDACKWFTDADVDVYAAEYGRTGFQGALNNYRRSAGANTELLTFSGRTIDVPSIYIAGKSDWGVYQAPGAIDVMRSQACTKMVGFHLVDGAGHWVQQEQSEQVVKIVLAFLGQQA